jgi:glycosyltransferase involved in cell wall biosynthesis
MGTPTGRPALLSILVPVFNEEGNVRLLYERALPVLESLGVPWEIVFVDDGSRDETFPRLRALHEEDRRVRVVRLRRNFGQTAAMAAGFQHVRGERIVTLDGDLQNDPADIPLLLAKMDEGYEVVSGWRKNRKEPFLERRLPSLVANRLIARLSGVQVHDFGCTLKAYDRRVIERIPVYAETHRFLPAFAPLAGARAAEVVVRHHPRHSGRSKYGLSRVGKVVVDLFALRAILRFSTRPRHGFAGLALPFGVLGLFFAAWTGYLYVRLPSWGAWIVLPGVTFLLFFLWFSLLSFGWFAELVVATGDRERRRVGRLTEGDA